MGEKKKKDFGEEDREDGFTGSFNGNKVKWEWDLEGVRVLFGAEVKVTRREGGKSAQVYGRKRDDGKIAEE